VVIAGALRGFGAKVLLGILAMSSISCRAIVGGSAEEEGGALAQRIRTAADLTCIETWADQVAKQAPPVKGGAAIGLEVWPECVQKVPLDNNHSLRVIRVVVGEDRKDTTLYLGRIWRLTVGAPPQVGPRRWPLSSRAYLWCVES
jgi:hypothetical protein